MSRERKLRRDTRHSFSGLDLFIDIIRQIAAQEQRHPKNNDDWKAYTQELIDRGIIIDQGLLPSGQSSISFRFDRLGPGAAGPALPLEQILGADRPIRRGA